MKKAKILFTISVVLLAIIVLFGGWYFLERNNWFGVFRDTDYSAKCYKPVIYLYPTEETAVSVKMHYNGELTCTYPEYNGEWNVTAYPDGTLIDDKGQIYNYLYWEGLSDVSYDFSKGFCVKGEDTASFLETALAKLGLN